MINQIVDTAAPLLVVAALGLLLKAVHAGLSALAKYLESKTNDEKRKAAIEHVCGLADQVVTAIARAEKPALLAAAGGLKDGKLPPGIGEQLKAKAIQAVQAQAPAALSTLQEVEGLSDGAIQDFLNHAIETAVARSK